MDEQTEAPAGSVAEALDGEQLDGEHAVVLFDGVCNLCNASVQFIVDRDPQGYFRFASLQSDLGQALCRRHGIPAGEMRSVVLIEEGKAYTESAAALRICRRLAGPWFLLSGLLVVPASVRNALYRWIARRRYRWFGTTEVCRVPAPALRERFLSPG